MTEKSDTAFRTISEAADEIGVPAHVLRFWETRFSMLQPLKRAGGRRYYRPVDMSLLRQIKALLHDDGMTIRGAQLALAVLVAPSASCATHSTTLWATQSHAARRASRLPVRTRPRRSSTTHSRRQCTRLRASPTCTQGRRAPPHPYARGPPDGVANRRHAQRSSAATSP